MEQYTNELIHESSLYLQQHAHNPVNWVSWSKEAFERAEKEGKLVLVSVGYSACHWCHVMEHECFEDEEVAALMNKHFVCIKVDREERPDVDQVYMTAVQLMTQRGGWPLNCFTIPNGQPIYGGTYFPKEQWMHVLKSLNQTYTSEPEKVLEYAKELSDGVQQSDLIAVAEPIKPFPTDKLFELVRRWQSRMDMVEGGPTSAPKFPLPSNLEFLLYYGVLEKHEEIQKYVNLTLHKMALGGIYDQVGGGFSRYSVDLLWKIPHFEKMLYDNGQLLSVYAQAYRETKNPEYKRVLDQTLTWLEREMQSEEGGLFAAQDADSEGVEGKYYVWTKEEIEATLGENASWFWKFYNPGNKGYWEDQQWVLLRNETWEEFCKANPDVNSSKIQDQLDTLFYVRKKRIAPVTDTKCLTAWNALTLTGLIEAFKATEDHSYLRLALQIAKWIRTFQTTSDFQLFHTRQNGRSFITGFLDDYATSIQAFLTLYQITADEEDLIFAKELCNYALKHFHDEQSEMFYFTADDHDLIARKMEINDNVIPSTNSIMANNLLSLSLLVDELDWELKAKQMLQNVIDGMEQYGSGYSNWALLLLRFQKEVRLLTIPSSGDWINLRKLSSPFVVVRFTNENTATVCAEGVCSIPMVLPYEVENYLKNM
ncbi:thioredoxin domain-containing protein [Fluviicola taffensis]|uniref:Spermatogenesis-associated protein 20-like TRX domain-containing protein n=1 Tax=Fluviicola taffensis (strain DSM 16823 / NCIMB 13979 / RW262) TaxID=755732 RepID=F2IJT0_FLUTR|nr:thioredoxin domain-containing protein [Fluviicola taffensis]AEA43970.1 protein of unknown function DUF255 [Fluviicola taffensis DSM 16823]